MSYAQHPLSAAFPAMGLDDFRALVDDIRQHGQRDPATLYDGMVLDGWHRYRATQEVGIPCRFEEFAGIDAIAFVRSKNQHRRHYMKSQQAAIEVSLTTWAEAHRPNKGEVASPLCENGYSTNKMMADRAGTSERTIQQAKRAHESGLGDAVRDGRVSAEVAAKIANADPELAKAVAHGEISLPKAVEQISGKRPGAKPAIQDTGPDNEAPTPDDEKDFRIECLQEDNDRLANIAAATVFNGTDEERADLLNRLNELTAENKHLRMLNAALTESRDKAMRENVQLRKQLEINTKKLRAVA